jgi:hypothetical protein
MEHLAWHGIWYPPDWEITNIQSALASNHSVQLVNMTEDVERREIEMHQERGRTQRS